MRSSARSCARDSLVVMSKRTSSGASNSGGMTFCQRFKNYTSELL